MIDINKIYLDNCFNVFPQIDNNSIDLLFTDMPWNLIDCEWDKEKIDINLLWLEIKRICRKRANIVMFSKQPFTTRLINAATEKWFRYQLIWIKFAHTNAYDAKRRPLNCHEEILVFGQGQGTYNPQFWYSTPYHIKEHEIKNKDVFRNRKIRTEYNNKDGKRYPLSYLRVKSDKGLHPTQKPLELCEWIVKTYSNENDIVLDPFSGSGTIPLACKNNNRKYIGIELNEKYYNISIERLNK